MHSKPTDTGDTATRSGSRLTRERSRWAVSTSTMVSLALHGTLVLAAPSCGFISHSATSPEVLLEVEDVTLADAPDPEANEDRTHVASPDQQVRPTDAPEAAPRLADDDAVADAAQDDATDPTRRAEDRARTDADAPDARLDRASDTRARADDAARNRPDKDADRSRGDDADRARADKRDEDRDQADKRDEDRDQADKRDDASDRADKRDDAGAPDDPHDRAAKDVDRDPRHAADPRAADDASRKVQDAPPDGAVDATDPRTNRHDADAPDPAVDAKAPPTSTPTPDDPNSAADRAATADPRADAEPPRDTSHVKDRKVSPNPNPLEPRPKIPDLFKQYVHTDAAAATATGTGDWISANHANAPTHRAVDASSTAGAAVETAAGDSKPTVHGQQRRVDTPASQRGQTEDAEGTESNALPDWVRADPTPPSQAPTAPSTPASLATAPIATQAGAAASPTAPSTPTTTQTRAQAQAQPVSTQAAAATTARQAVAPVSARAASTAARAVSPSPALPVVDTPPPSEEGWAPKAFRMPPAPPRAAVANTRESAARAARSAQTALQASQASVASKRAVQAPSQRTPDAVASAVAPPPSPVPPPKPPMTAADSLRVALGWGTRDQDHTTAPKAVQGTLGGDATPLGGTATVLPEDAVADGQAGVSAVATPTGRYIAEVEALVVERWNANPVPPDQVAMGVSGSVVVELRIDRTGRVFDVRIVKHSGFPILDMQARNAIPDRVPRIPHDVPQDEIVERVTMRTRNATPVRTAP